MSALCGFGFRRQRARKAAGQRAGPPTLTPPSPPDRRPHVASPLVRRSLVNTLNVVKRKLAALKGQPHTAEDLAHFQVGLALEQRRGREHVPASAAAVSPLPACRAAACLLPCQSL